MKTHVQLRKQQLPFRRDVVFSFFKNPENLACITPEWLSFKVLTPAPISMRPGALIDYTIRWLGIRLRWRTLITAYEPLSRFVDEQVKGPYAFWKHTHLFEECAGGTEMVDEVKVCAAVGRRRRDVASSVRSTSA